MYQLAMEQARSFSMKARRVSRACDECRKRKTKCIGQGQHCQTCVAKNVACTFQFPSCKRGPKPKQQQAGYFSLPISSSSPTSPHEHAPSTDPTIRELDLLYSQGELPWMSNATLKLLHMYFLHIHPLTQNLVDPIHFLLGITQPHVSPSFRLLLWSMLALTTRSIPSLGSYENPPSAISPAGPEDPEIAEINYQLCQILFRQSHDLSHIL
ncbi:hypothetical protein DSO57_1003669 [Entomophthora muscae]|uniref:Uncharacterized protein n=1 Tax=Entomophthora muscae TaxID=34485 RepID=A0ACC2T8A5_9FUNG|nr:hypothetical protein DSO57_1003669 [Entomophthora muscae]